MNRRRIPVLYETPSFKVTRPIEGEVEIELKGEKLQVVVELDESDMRELVRGIREVFEKIRQSRDIANHYNSEALEGR